VWTYFLVFTFAELKISKSSSVNTLKAQLIFPFKPIFSNLFEFSEQKSLKNQYLPHLTSENYEIKSIKSDSPRAFQQHQEHPHIRIQFAVSILSNFQWENYPIINSFHIIAPNNLKSSWCIPSHQELSKDIKSITWNTMVWELSTWQNKLTLTLLI